MISQVITWLECLEIVNSVSAVNTFTTFLKVILTFVLMFPLGVGLNGYAYGYAVAQILGGVVLWLVVFKWRKEHIKPTRYWFGFDWGMAADRSTNIHYLKMACPMIIQYCVCDPPPSLARAP